MALEIHPIEFDGLQAVELTSPSARMVVITGMGPRIAFFGKPGGENLLYWKNDNLGREGWKLLGGHRVWVTRPLADESEDAYAADNGPCEVHLFKDGLDVTGEMHPVLHTRRGLRIRQVGGATFQVTAFITNCGPMLYSGGVWSPTCTNPDGGKEYGIPLGDRRLSWDVINLVIPRTFAGHTARVNDPQITFNEDFLIARPRGVESKRMVMAPMGFIVMTWPEKNLSFIKHTSYHPNGRYPFGCNLALYIGPDNFMVEMETYGEEQVVMPGATIENRETWRLVERVFDWSDPELLRGELERVD
jgi:hypothetical protein